MPVEPITVMGSDSTSVLQLYPIGSNTPADRIVEGATYKFRLIGSELVQSYEPGELIRPDPDDALVGRFTPLNHVGVIRFQVARPDGTRVSFDVRVDPVKLEYETEYRWLLEQVADRAAEAVLQGFAPSVLQATSDPDAVGELAYRSLAFLAARFDDPQFQAAIVRVLRSPNRRWAEVSDPVSISRGVRPGPAIARALTRPGRHREPVPSGLEHLPVSHVPSVMEVGRNEVTYDTTPNRFVKFAFERWRGIASDLDVALAGDGGSGDDEAPGPVRRGRAVAQRIAGECDQVLREPVFDDVGSMREFPHGDPVLLGQAGYRELLRVFALAEASMGLGVELDDDLFAATQRNVATLYEYWSFLVLAGCLADLCGGSANGVLFQPDERGMSLALKQGQASRLGWKVERAGRRLDVRLWFNRTFPKTANATSEHGSWASSIRPDASLRIRPETGRPDGASDPFLDTWLHFDAKYALEGQQLAVEEQEPQTTAKRNDLLKMHAYRDLIRRTAGAYVLYPGSGDPHRALEFEEVHEILPGIGAFPLRPGSGGEVRGLESLKAFLDETLDLTANQASANERRRYWEREHTKVPARSLHSVNFLGAPPADELVLVGYVRPGPHREWVSKKSRYNLRGDGRVGSVRPTDEMLGAVLVLLWTRNSQGQAEWVGLFERTGPWQVASAADLAADGYPSKPTARGYLVTSINAVSVYLEGLVRPIGEVELEFDGRPAASTWEHVGRVAKGAM